MTSILNETGESTSAAGRPDFQKLIQAGVVQLGPDGWPLGSAKNPVVGETIKYMRVEGVKVARKIPINSGHAKNPDFPAWRAGLNPEKYHAKVLKEAEIKAATGKKVRFAPELQAEEAQDYIRWLEEQNIEAPEESVVKNIEEAKDEAIAETLVRAKRIAGEKKPTAKKPGRPKKVEVEAAAEEVQE